MYWPTEKFVRQFTCGLISGFFDWSVQNDWLIQHDCESLIIGQSKFFRFDSGLNCACFRQVYSWSEHKDYPFVKLKKSVDTIEIFVFHSLLNYVELCIFLLCVVNVTYKQQSAVPLDIDTHGGEDVPIYAIGPMSYLFTGVLEQHTIPHLMMHAACIGPKKSYTCPPKRSSAATFTNSPVTFNLLKVGLTVQLTWAIFSWIRLN